MDNTYVDVAYAVIKRLTGAEPYAPAVGDLAQRLRPVIVRAPLMEQAELVAWLCAPLSELDGLAPAEILMQGRGQTVLDLLQTTVPGRMPPVT